MDGKDLLTQDWMGTCHFCLSRHLLHRPWNGCTHLLHSVRFASGLVHRKEDRDSTLRSQTDAEEDVFRCNAHLGFHFRRNGVVVGALDLNAVRSSRKPVQLGCSIDPVRAGSELHWMAGLDDRGLAILAVADDALGIALDIAVVVVKESSKQMRKMLALHNPR